ncbi:hypothetical protein SUGI_0416970 [Cryptomeria japonica]|nr:hypothetical protein SUGI_0416970 [Cryptomeria japonica]
MEEAGGAFEEFMKGGPCKRRYEIWKNCVDEAYKSGVTEAVDKCGQTTTLLHLCIDMNPQYYELQHLAETWEFTVKAAVIDQITNHFNTKTACQVSEEWRKSGRRIRIFRHRIVF